MNLPHLPLLFTGITPWETAKAFKVLTSYILSVAGGLRHLDQSSTKKNAFGGLACSAILPE